ncbi:VTT domain-containing protein [Fluviicola taffensis]|uniref:SNARE associated Golgi protein-related protein n=1 Tax=Fluviicola taffensis (strain DSM 16823 / NCIMB 13979 / RW262) TaxID=755732 RepID=F2IBX4_FLUTR|nr:VTT domain-containing protein [Fluviicola taffensis]AEA42202.1 SNARE associated Golgi protein-related protein [Fluviicola taffensis DSM 16823]
MIEFFHQLFDLQNFGTFINTYENYIYVILFLVIFVETGLVIMPFLPGDSLLFTAGLFAASGHLSIALLLSLLVFAAILGDNVNYWIGRKIGLNVFNWKIRGRQLVKPIYLEKTEAFFEKNGVKAIIMARFVPFVRTFTPFAAGIGKMNYRKFFLFDVIGGFLWIFGLTLAGYFLGGIDWIKENIEKVCLGIIFISLLPMIISFLKSKFTKKDV